LFTLKAPKRETHILKDFFKSKKRILLIVK
jgi:hypothetical protein